MPPLNTIDDFWRLVAKGDGCWLWTRSVDTGGYGRFRYRGKTHLAHRFSWMLAHGTIDPSLDVLHGCDNPRCVRPDHLSLGTHTENMRDMFAKGRRRIARGVEQPSAKIDEQRVREIRARHARGESQRALAKAFSISQTNVGMIVRRETWTHVQEQP